MSDIFEKEIRVIFEDDDILIISKPAGVTVNKAETTRHEITIQDWVEERFRSSGLEFNQEQGDFYNRGGIVHRLDKETSGVLILAKNPRSLEILQKQFKERVVEKEYIALSHDRVVPDRGEIKVPVGRLPWNRKRFGVVPGGRESVTYYKVINYYTYDKQTYSLLSLFPKTGRTHQIRVHLKYLGYPIFADFLYAGRKISKHDRKLLERVFLHAAKISFMHPRSGIRKVFECDLPSELKNVLDKFEMIN